MALCWAKGVRKPRRSRRNHNFISFHTRSTGLYKVHVAGPQKRLNNAKCAPDTPFAVPRTHALHKALQPHREGACCITDRPRPRPAPASLNTQEPSQRTQERRVLGCSPPAIYMQIHSKASAARSRLACTTSPCSLQRQEVRGPFRHRRAQGSPQKAWPPRIRLAGRRLPGRYPSAATVPPGVAGRTLTRANPTPTGAIPSPASPLRATASSFGVSYDP